MSGKNNIKLTKDNYKQVFNNCNKIMYKSIFSDYKEVTKEKAIEFYEYLLINVIGCTGKKKEEHINKRFKCYE